MKIRKPMSQQNINKVPVSFRDVAACFSEEEWSLLHVWQKELYRTVMNEIHQALISLGPLIASSIFSLKANENEDLCPMKHQSSVARHGIDKTVEMFTKTDILCGINREEHLCMNLGPPDTDRRDHECLNTGEPVFNVDSGMRTEEEFESRLVENCGTKDDSCTDPSSEHVYETPVLLRIKEEVEPYSMIHEDVERGESIRSPTRFPYLNSELVKSFEEHHTAEEGESSSSPHSGLPVIKSVAAIVIKEEQEICSVDELDLTRSTSHPNLLELKPPNHQGEPPRGPGGKSPRGPQCRSTLPTRTSEESRLHPPLMGEATRFLQMDQRKNNPTCPTPPRLDVTLESGGKGGCVVYFYPCQCTLLHPFANGGKKLTKMEAITPMHAKSARLCMVHKSQKSCTPCHTQAKLV
ncbi:zinc finger protein 124 isoform X5 [Ambystoma mexicanum]|uniref:zinc finger protein 124 isoform X5 n=1 Tax=Ambystoma mexicanum TaxID=8296 RepID=UPI0037E89B50